MKNKFLNRVKVFLIIVLLLTVASVPVTAQKSVVPVGFVPYNPPFVDFCQCEVEDARFLAMLPFEVTEEDQDDLDWIVWLAMHDPSTPKREGGTLQCGESGYFYRCFDPSSNGLYCPDNDSIVCDAVVVTCRMGDKFQSELVEMGVIEQSLCYEE